MTATDLETFATDHGIKIDHISHGLKRDESGWAHFAFTVAITTDRDSWSTTYRMGTGHATKSKRIKRGSFTVPRDYLRDFYHGRITVHMMHDQYWLAPTPSVADVLASLVCDASEFIDGPITFEDWADNYGYDVDSRAAEKIYRACHDTAAALVKLLGGTDNVRRLVEAAQDY